MTDKTPQNQAENPVNTPTTLTDTTDTARDGELKSRALPQADALKERFKAGSIPLQTDFADLVDLANMGRQAVGGTEGQTGPANGFTLSLEGRLELKPNAAKGIVVDKDGIAVKLQVTSNGVGLNNTAWIKMMCGLHNATFYVSDTYVCVFFCNHSTGCTAYVYGRGGYYLSMYKGDVKLNSVDHNEIISMVGSGSIAAATMVSWKSTKAAAGISFKYLGKNLITSTSHSGSVTLVAAP
uniref:hypothetical protein n=1 Tax=Serratia proteamaculans TaxID=28151 RepID=UPI001F4C2017|nr:hypothetical protein [Serratia proteamaculans]